MIMKHSIKVTFILISIFFLSQVFGLLALNMDLKVTKNVETGVVENISYSEPVIGARPEMSSNVAFWYILTAVLIGTILLLVLIKYRQVRIWKAWFFLAVWMTIAVSLGIFISKTLAFIFAFIIALFKILRPNFYLQNISEILMYTGIALLFVPLLNVFWVAMLLLAIAVYDAYAVWQSKHMVKMANFQTEAKLFAGLSVPYKLLSDGKSELKVSVPKTTNFKTETRGERVALLGGGDIAFPLIFAGVVMQSLVLNYNLGKAIAFADSLIISFFAGLALLLLFVYGKKDRFYPAMPFISLGCLIGYGLILLLQLI